MKFVRREGWQGRSVVLLFYVSEESGTERFEPRPSPEICPFCDYRIVCPAAEK